MSQPPRSSLKFSPTMPPSGGSVGDGQICFLAIPLITIVAWFVLNLFLPIIVFLFGLWFLLRLKLCIPPSVSVSAGVEAQLAVAAEFDLDLDIGVHVGFDANALHGSLTSHIANATGGGAAAQTDLAEFGNKPLALLDAELTRPHKGPDFAAGIVWEEPVARAEVLVA
jgi:hypothetical protein